MRIRWKNGAALIEGVEFDAQLTLIDSAQSFVWQEFLGKYYAVLFGSPVSLQVLPQGLLLSPVGEDRVEDCLLYLDLVRDYGALRMQHSAYPRIAEAMALLPGLRILNQPTWEVLLSFIISANNNVARIRKLCWLLGEHFGEAYELDSLVLHALPSPQKLSQVPEDALRALGFGYRAPFLIQTAKMVADGFPLDALSDLPYEQAHAQLLQLPGVGDKVADCVQLFGCGFADAFPVDVWVARLMEAWFPALAQGLSRPKLAQAAREQWGAQAGIAQQFLFHCARCGLIPLQ